MKICWPRQPERFICPMLTLKGVLQSICLTLVVEWADVVHVNVNLGAKPQMCHFWLGDVRAQCWAQYQSHHPRFSQDRCIPAKTPAAKVSEGNLNWRWQWHTEWQVVISEFRHALHRPIDHTSNRSQILSLLSDLRIRLKEARFGHSGPWLPVILARVTISHRAAHKWIVIPLSQTVKPHTYNPYTEEVYKCVQTSAPTIWRLFQFWGWRNRWRQHWSDATGRS